MGAGLRKILDRSVTSGEEVVKMPGPAAQWIGISIGIAGFLFGILSYFLQAGSSDQIISLKHMFWLAVLTLAIMSIFLLTCIVYLVKQDNYVQRSIAKDTRRQVTISSLRSEKKDLGDLVKILEQKIIDEKNRYQEDSDKISQFVAAHLQDITKRIRDISIGAIHFSSGQLPDQLAKLRSDVKITIEYIDRITSEILTKTTGIECSSSIKTLIMPENGDSVNFITIHRHSPLHPSREEIDKDSNGMFQEHQISSNSTYLSILHNREEDFISNPEDTSSTKFILLHNDNWGTFYDSCLVVPISGPSQFYRTNKKRRNGDTIVGFLSIDNFGGRFRREYEAKIAWQMSYFLFTLVEISKFLENCEEEFRVRRLA